MLAVLFCDLDGFKVINDTLGHAVGDDVLVQVASRLRRRRRKSDTIARTGGDEFVIVCDELSEPHDAIDISAQIRDVVEQPMVAASALAPVSISIGIATVQGVAAKGMDPVTLLGNADAAMYRAKQSGKARWHMFDDTLIEERLAPNRTRVRTSARIGTRRVRTRVSADRRPQAPRDRRRRSPFALEPSDAWDPLARAVHGSG